MSSSFYIQGHVYIQCHLVTVEPGRISWTSKGDIDGDGSGPSHGDPDYQNDTTLHFEGKPLNSDTTRYFVVPPAVRDCVEAVVMGAQGYVTYNGKRVSAVVGDIGPRSKIGEMSIACAAALGIPDSPTRGGVPAGVFYEIIPGLAAVVDGVTFTLQPA